jgi:hypothetical protein
MLSPSGASGWMNCAGWRGNGKSSEYAREGTAAHEVASFCLTNGTDAEAYIGRVITVEGQDFIVDPDMAEHVQKYVDTVRQVRDATGGELLVEQRLPIGHITGEEGAEGTGDAVILAGDELIVIDLKFGRGVQVDAFEVEVLHGDEDHPVVEVEQGNPQLMMYALGALEQFGMLADFQRARVMIVQPRIGHVSEWSCTLKDLQVFAERAREAAMLATPSELPVPVKLTPGEKQCRWCSNKPTCKAVTEQVVSLVTGTPREVVATLSDFQALGPAIERNTAAVRTDEPDQIAALLPHLDLIADFCKAVAARGEELARSGREVPGYKLVRGRAGARRWADAATAEAALKSMRLKHEQMFDYSLISPTTAEKLAKAETIGKRQWPKLQALIVQPEGGLTLVPASDKRPPVPVTPPAAVAAEFADLTTASEQPAEVEVPDELALDLI